jgi:hypothetical protein
MVHRHEDSVADDAEHDKHLEHLEADDALQTLLEVDESSRTLPVAKGLVEPFLRDL